MIRSLLLLVVTCLLGACQSQPPVRLMPPPEAFVKSENNLFSVNQNLERSGDVKALGEPVPPRDPASTGSYGVEVEIALAGDELVVTVHGDVVALFT